MEIVEGNRIIAEFMGCHKYTFWVGGEQVDRYGFKETHITERWHEGRFDTETPYHLSWDWLMPVWNKFRQSVWGEFGGYPEEFDEYKALFLRAVFNGDILGANSAVYKGIQWYNQQSGK
jgi:hypothetical protein